MSVMLPSVFINYRRIDTSAHANAIKVSIDGGLKARKDSKVFLDRSTLRPGQAWPAGIRDALTGCKVVLALMGPKWFASGDYGKRLLDDPADWVRRELEYAQANGKPVIPVTFEGFEMPGDPSALPESLAWLIECQAREIISRTWEENVRELIDLLKTDYDLSLGVTSVARPIPNQGPGTQYHVTAEGVVGRVPQALLDSEGNHRARLDALHPILSERARSLHRLCNGRNSVPNELQRSVNRFVLSLAGQVDEIDFTVFWGECRIAKESI